MKAGKQVRVMSMAVLALLVSGVFAVQDVEARERGAGASARTGGAPQASRSFSRQGTASAGSFAGSRSTTATVSTQPRQARPAGTSSSNQATRQSSRLESQEQRQEAASSNQAQRQSTSSSNQAQRQQASNENVETRQAGATARQQARPAAYPPGYRPPAAGYYPPPPPGYYYDDDDDWDAGSAAVGFVAGAVVGAVVTDAAHSSSSTSTSTSSAPPPPAPAPAPAPAPVAAAGLPCAPDVSSVNGVTYYRCGQSYYMQAYGPSGPVYMPVQPPEQAPAK